MSQAIASEATVDPGSFRDPSGHVYCVDDRVLRTVMGRAVADFDFVCSTGLMDELVADGLVPPVRRVDPGVLGSWGNGAGCVLEHPRLAFISYPYEWSFSALKAAALLHLDLHLRALEKGATLSDASAYNVQFQGSRPVFIDHLSFRRYRDGEFWTGHRQFCEQFLNPLLLRTILGVPHNAWYRGSQEGIATAELSRLIPLWRKLSWNVFTHVALQALFGRKPAKMSSMRALRRGLPLPAFRQMLRRLRAWISGLEPARAGKTTWRDYENARGYTAEETTRKRQIVSEFVAAVNPRMIWDLGCNAGEYSRAALASGVELAIGFDFDHGALEAAFARARAEDLRFLPLYLDAANPSPGQGWAEAERKGLSERATAEAVLALAFIHHLAIARNVPLPRVIDWVVDLAPSGLIEFVPKHDPMARQLLLLREDIFDGYTEERFLECLRQRARIVKVMTVTSTGRRVVWFSRPRRARRGPSGWADHE